MKKNNETKETIKRFYNKIFLLVLLFSFTLVSNRVFSNEVSNDKVSIAGRVFTQAEPPEYLPGVTVKVKDTDVGVISDVNGYYLIEANLDDVLIFSFIGFAEKEIIITKAWSNLNVSLKEEATALNEVVVTGYGRERKINMISSLASLDVSSNLVNKPITSMSQALQGGITGITVTQNSGLPGGDAATIKIRGISTLGNSTPLVLVDGVPMDMNDLDPATIENVTVLKDASAAAIYGARAANGVIVITTKRGKVGKVTVNYNNYIGVQEATYLPDFIDGARYLEVVNEATVNNGGAPLYSQNVIDATRNKSDLIKYPNVDWIDEMWIKNPILQNHSIGVQGGNSLARFALNINYLKQDGFLEHVNFERFSIRANTTVNLTDKITVNVDINTIRNDQNETNMRDNNTSYVLNHIYKAPPTLAAKYPTSESGQEFYGIFFEMRNPRAMIDKGGTTSILSDKISINIQPKWEIIKNLILRGQYSYRVSTSLKNLKRDTYNFFEYTTGKLNYTWGNIRGSSKQRSSMLFLGMNLDYTYVSDSHRIFTMVGANQELNSHGSWDEWAMRSFFGKINYTLKDKYLIEFTIRRDGSSRFGKGNKYGNFPSISAGWNIHQEDFVKALNIFDNFKVRASYGKLGNENIGLYQYQSLINSGDGTETVYGNPNITWETVNMQNYGVDITMFKNIDVVFDYYDKLTNDIILTPPQSYIGGTEAFKINAGEVRNKGWELSVNYNSNFNSLSFNIHVGLSKNINEIESLPGGPYINGSVIHKKGYALNSHYMYRTSGLLQESDFKSDGTAVEGVVLWGAQKPGDIHYLDIDKSGDIGDDDREIIGNSQPDFSYFTNLSLRWKNFDCEVLFQGVQGVDAYYSQSHAMPLNLNGSGSTPLKEHMDYWTPKNTTAFYPRLMPDPGNNMQPSDYWYFDASYLRVKYLQFGYTIKNLEKSIGLKSCRLFINAQNLLTFTSQDMIDPENRGSSSVYPLIKTYTVGINVKF